MCKAEFGIYPVPLQYVGVARLGIITSRISTAQLWEKPNRVVPVSKESRTSRLSDAPMYGHRPIGQRLLFQKSSLPTPRILEKIANIRKFLH